MKKLKYLIPVIITFIILGIIYYINGLYPFGNNPLVQVDADYLYIPTLYRVYDFLHNGTSIIYDKIGLGNCIYGSLIIQSSLFSPLNLLLYLIKRNDIINFMNVLIIIKICLISLTSFYYIDKRHNVNLFYKVLFSVLYAFNGFIILNYFNDIWLDIVILFPLVIYFLEELINKKKYKGYIITLSLCFIISIYYSVFLIVFILFYTFIYLNLYSKKIKESVFLLGKATVICLLISSFSSIPCLYQILSSGRFSSSGTPGLFDNIEMKSLYLLMSPLFIITFILLITNYRKCKKEVYAYAITFLLYLIPVIVDPINVSMHGGSFWSFPYRFGYITSFILMNGSLLYISKFVKEKNKFKISDIFYLINILSFSYLAYLLNKKYRSDIIDEGILLEIKSNETYVNIITIILIIFLIYIFVLLINHKNLKYVLLSLVSIFSILIISSWTIYFNDGYFLCTNAKELQENIELPKDGIYKVDYSTYTPDYGFMYDVDTLDNWLHILPEGMVDFYNKLGYKTSGTTIRSNGGTIFTDYILNFKYVLSYENLKDDNMYTELSSYNNKKLYKYNYNSSYAILFNNKEVEDTSSRFEYQNNIYKSLFNTEDNIIEFEFYESFEGKYLEYNIELSEESYLYFNTVYYDNIETIKLNNETINGYDNDIKSFGLRKGKINIKIYLKNDEYFNFDLGYIKKSDIYNLESSNVTYKEDKYYVTSEEEQYLFIPINNIKGIHVYNNDKEVEIESYINNFIMIKVNKGNNVISIKYELPFFKLGILLSIVGIILFIFIKKIIPSKLILNISYYCYTILIVGIYVYYYIYSLIK